MSFPPAFLDELRMRLSASDVIGRRVKLTRAGREFKACCPFHKEKSPSFTVNDSKGFFHCFGCGARGDIIGFTMRNENRSFPEAVEVLANLAGLPVPQASPEEQQRYEREKNLYTLIEDSARWFEEQLYTAAGRLALDYARSRGLSDESISRFRLGFAPNDGQALVKMLTTKGYTPQQMVDAGLVKKAENEDRYYSFFRGRLIFPVGDRRGRVVAFGARLLEGEGPKYINSADHSLFHKGQLLYGFSRARTAAADGVPIIITEGYMDVIRLVEAGFTGAVAPLGTALTEEQIQLVWKIIPKPPVRPDLLNHIPVLCFDGDNAGQRAAERSLDRILPFLAADQSARFAIMPAGEDPDSLIRKKGPQAMQAVIDEAKSLIDFMWEITASGRPLNTPEDRAGFRQALNTRIATIKDNSIQQDYRNTIQELWRNNFSTQYNSKNHRDEITNKFYKKRMFTITIQPKPLPENQSEVFIITLINHSSLIKDFGEILYKLPINDKKLDALRELVLNGAAEFDYDVSHDILKNYIHDNGGEELLNYIVRSKSYQLIKYTSPNSSINEAKRGLYGLWIRHMMKVIQDDVRSASSEHDFTRVNHLNEELQELQNKENALFTSDVTVH